MPGTRARAFHPLRSASSLNAFRTATNPRGACAPAHATSLFAADPLGETPTGATETVALPISIERGSLSDPKGTCAFPRQTRAFTLIMLIHSPE